jgi:exonuclease VII small subunit
MRLSTEELLRNLEEKAERLASKQCPYLAAVLLQYYDGERAEETKAARLKAARKYLDLVAGQPKFTSPP